MLKELHIRNLAIIDDLTVTFEKGLNVLTGETGAGKSIIVDALSLALGSRAQSDMIKAGEKEALLQASFELDDTAGLPDLGIDFSEGIMMRRVISAAGKSRAYINDTMVTLQSLSELSSRLVDIHSQHEHQSLLSAETQRRLLDSYGNHQAEAEAVRQSHALVASIREELSGLRVKAREKAQRTDLLRFQINEIGAAGLRPGEKEALEDERKILSNLSRLKELTEISYELLHEADGACTEMLAQVISRLRDMQALDPAIGETLNLTEAAMPLLEDAAIALRAFRDRYNLDPARLDELQERIEQIRRLQKKYGETIEEILAFYTKASDELASIEASDERLQTLEAGLAKESEALLTACRRLSEKRKKTAGKIEKLMAGTLQELAFADARFSVALTQEIDPEGRHRITAHGMDRIDFLFSANPGEPEKPLARIASGGELSRIMLALKSILGDVDNVPVLIFDEVDAGIGGKTAESVGRKLQSIAASHQLICITHLPQIASLADHHLKIEKRQVTGAMQVSVQPLTGAGRQQEVARMLSGSVTEISRRHAEELLGRKR